MKLGFFGLGNLGMPFALGWIMRGHQVFGYDKNPDRMDVENFNEMEATPPGCGTIKEELRKAVSSGRLLMCADPMDVMYKSDIIFITVQTPSQDNETSDYDLGPLKVCIQEVTGLMAGLSGITNGKTFVIVSTVLPGTTRALSQPFSKMQASTVVYNPAFCAMGTVIPDMFNPEFVLLGFAQEPFSGGIGVEVGIMSALYRTVTDSEVLLTNYENAEMTKCCYNAFITTKINFANSVMELAHKVSGCDADVIMDNLKKAKNRLISTRYLSGGMGDQGGCHIKEARALSYLASMKSVSYNWPKQSLDCRLSQFYFIKHLLADVIEKNQEEYSDIWIMGRAFKPETNLTDESLGVKMYEKIKAEWWHHKVRSYDPIIDCYEPEFDKAIFFIATKHEAFRKLAYPTGSIVVDPWRYVEKPDGVELIQVGRCQ